MTDHDIIFGVVNKLDKEKFDITLYGPNDDGKTFLEVYRRKDRIETYFIFNKEGKLIDIWTETY